MTDRVRYRRLNLELETALQDETRNSERVSDAGRITADLADEWEILDNTPSGRTATEMADYSARRNRLAAERQRINLETAAALAERIEIDTRINRLLTDLDYLETGWETEYIRAETRPDVIAAADRDGTADPE